MSAGARALVELRDSRGAPVVRRELWCDEVADPKHPRAGWWCLLWEHWHRATPIDGEPGVFYAFVLSHEANALRGGAR